MNILIGKVSKPQGINGEIKMQAYIDNFNSIKNVKEVIIDDKCYKIMAKRDGGDSVYLSLFGVADRNEAELLRGKEIYADKDLIIKDSDNYFIEDIIGCDVYLASGKLIGKIFDITNSNVDIFHINTTEGKACFPFLKKLNAIVDIENKKITVDSKAFTEVVLYEEN